jgi:hypothetical protein
VWFSWLRYPRNLCFLQLPENWSLSISWIQWSFVVLVLQVFVLRISSLTNTTLKMSQLSMPCAQCHLRASNFIFDLWFSSSVEILSCWSSSKSTECYRNYWLDKTMLSFITDSIKYLEVSFRLSVRSRFLISRFQCWMTRLGWVKCIFWCYKSLCRHGQKNTTILLRWHVVVMFFWQTKLTITTHRKQFMHNLSD